MQNQQHMNLIRRTGFILGPLLFVLVLCMDVGQTPTATRVLAVAAWMLFWWMTEALPIYITAMLPMVLFPALGVMGLKETFIPYGSPIIFLFLGGFIIALAMEERKLHERIAYGLVRITGHGLHGVVFGFMAASAVVAMWISNTATAVMMLPIAVSVLHLVQNQANAATSSRFALLLMLGIAYGANIGGTVTLIGTPPNLVFAGYWFDAFGVEFSFARWLAIGIPFGLTMLLATFMVLTRMIYPLRERNVVGLREMFDSKWLALGKMQGAELLVLAIFSATVGCWVFSSQINGLLDAEVLNNTNIAMGGGLLMFMVPVSWRRGEFILQWSATQRLPWGILILFGGGLSLASGLEQAGIIQLVGDRVADSFQTSPILLCLSLTIMALLATEVMSNVALVTVMLPVVFGIAENMDINAAYLAIPVTLASSCAFMMPISTPPNAVVYANGNITVGQMMRAGLWINLLAVALIVGFAQLYF
jgi:solute carrier family 13 (sodium-dependent dicarboxylate transporter), member 2/3/5